MNDKKLSPKVAVIGTGMVGSSFAYALTIKGTVRELALINRTPERAEGEAMDLNHGLSFLSPMNIQAGGYELCRDAQVVVITAGAPQKPGETRLDLAKKNAAGIEEIVPKILEFNPSPILLMVSNPVDILTYVALKVSGLPSKQVIGSGTVLDSSRFRFLLSGNCAIDPRSVHAHIISEHGDSEVAVWSRVNIAGIPLHEYCSICDRQCPKATKDAIFENVKKAAYDIIAKKGATYYAIGLALTRIVEAIVRDEHSILTVSSLVEDYYGISNVCLSLPSVVGRQGVEKVITASLNDAEARALQNSAQILRENLKSLGW
ncbi:MAG: L-lactate dehydrogenase [Thermodesulfobacteriota bacterium]